MTLEQQLNEYEVADNDKRAILLYANYGLAMYNAQLLEQQAINMLAIHKIFKTRATTQEDKDTIWESYDFSTKTLGVMANDLKQAYNISDEDMMEFNTVLYWRNTLTHKYFRFNDVLFLSESGRKRMVSDFAKFTFSAKAVDEKLERYLEKYHKRAGITQESIKAMYDEVKEHWKDAEIDDSYDSTNKNN